MKVHKLHTTLASVVLAGGLLLSGMAQAHDQYIPGFGGVVQAQHNQYRGYQPVNYGYQNHGNPAYQYGHSDYRDNHHYGHQNGYDRGHHYGHSRGHQRGHHYGHQQHRHHGHHHR